MKILLKFYESIWEKINLPFLWRYGKIKWSLFTFINTSVFVLPSLNLIKTLFSLYKFQFWIFHHQTSINTSVFIKLIKSLWWLFLSGHHETILPLLSIPKIIPAFDPEVIPAFNSIPIWVSKYVPCYLIRRPSINVGLLSKVPSTPWDNCRVLAVIVFCQPRLANSTQLGAHYVLKS